MGDNEEENVAEFRWTIVNFDSIWVLVVVTRWIGVSDKLARIPTCVSTLRGSEIMHSSSPPSTSSNASASRSLFTIFGRAENVHRKLLYELMSTVHEYLVVTVQSNAASVVDQRTSATDESLFLRIHRSIEQIFLNGLRLFKPDVSSVWYQTPFMLRRQRRQADKICPRLIEIFKCNQNRFNVRKFGGEENASEIERGHRKGHLGVNAARAWFSRFRMSRAILILRSRLLTTSEIGRWRTVFAVLMLSFEFDLDSEATFTLFHSVGQISFGWWHERCWFCYLRASNVNAKYIQASHSCSFECRS